ncbi:hypothetical protein DRP53_08325 [candidate division WOR-3 bacterium]|uniref:Uncharacterized protein n=1 Tax=candidate division WOR-3 bacterium TaxID=2052148 RepID=A0A660SHE0_UNCW3|nr:MAG: hypothetical protein DRP53_08325 [candidate division WOR-3 bacterium]
MMSYSSLSNFNSERDMARETEESKSGIDMIKPTSFYSSESEKVKLNWFCYELSMGIYDEIKGSLGERLKKYKIDDESLAEFSIYIAKKMKEIILQKLSGKIEMVYISYEMVESYFPNLRDSVVNKMLDAISKAWDELISFCERCPTQCISEKDAYCTMFDEGPY